MRIFLAGATGAIGRVLLEQLLEAGHQVTATTRSPDRAGALRLDGAEPVVLDAFDAPAVTSAMSAARPEVVIHQLTALPAEPGPRSMRRGLLQTGRLRSETVPIFAEAARRAGARRLVVQSMCFVTRPDGPAVLDEDAPIWTDGPRKVREAFVPVQQMEDAVRRADGLEGVILRYGFFYGPGSWYAPEGAVGRLIRKRAFPLVGSGEGRQAFVHVEDAARATVLALDHGAPGVFNVCDDESPTQNEWLPEMARCLGAKPPLRIPAWLMSAAAGPLVAHYATTLRGASNTRAKETLGFRPRPWRDGFREVFGGQ